MRIAGTYRSRAADTDRPSVAAVAAVLPWLASAEDERHSRRLRAGVAAAVAVHIAVLWVPLVAEPEAQRVLRPVARFVLAPPPDFRPRERPPVPPEPRPVAQPSTAPRVVPVPELPAPEPIDRPAEPVDAWSASLADPSPDPIAIPDEPPPTEAEPAVDWTSALTPPVRVSGRDPVYTECGRRAHVEGTVSLRATIDKDGSVQAVTTGRGLPCGLTEAAASAVREWRFRPAMRGDLAVAVRYDVRVAFRLR